jgi:hypothetical protein
MIGVPKILQPDHRHGRACVYPAVNNVTSVVCDGVPVVSHCGLLDRRADWQDNDPNTDKAVQAQPAVCGPDYSCAQLSVLLLPQESHTGVVQQGEKYAAQVCAISAGGLLVCEEEAVPVSWVKVVEVLG